MLTLVLPQVFDETPRQLDAVLRADAENDGARAEDGFDLSVELLGVGRG